MTESDEEAAQDYTFTVVYALSRGGAGGHECRHHVAYVVAPWSDEAVERCRQDALPGFVFQLIAVFEGYCDRRWKGDDVRVHDFRAPKASP